MTEETVLQTLNGIFADVLGLDDVQLQMSTTAPEVEGWDSMSHVMLVVEIERRFKVKFKTREIQDWKCVGDIVKSLMAA